MAEKKEAAKAAEKGVVKKEVAKRKTADDLRDGIEKAEKALDEAKEKFIEAGADLEEARTAFLEERTREAGESQA